MKNHSALLFFALLVSAQADTLSLRDGTTVAGSWLGVASGQISFLVGNQIRKYPRSDVSEVRFGSAPAPAPSQDPVPQTSSTVVLGNSETAAKKDASVPPQDLLKPGQTVEQIEAFLGKPASMFRVGSKSIYVYKDPPVKITFLDGKVVALE